jgi:hypothetical protein
MEGFWASLVAGQTRRASLPNGILANDRPGSTILILLRSLCFPLFDFPWFASVGRASSTHREGTEIDLPCELGL